MATSIFKIAVENIVIDSKIDVDCWRWKLLKKDNFSFKSTWGYLKGFEQIWIGILLSGTELTVQRWRIVPIFLC